MKKIFVILLVLLVTSCNKDKPNVEQMVKIYNDILTIRSQYSDTAIANPKIDSVIKSNGFNKNEFKKTLVDLFEHDKDFINKIDSLRSKITPNVQPVTAPAKNE